MAQPDQPNNSNNQDLSGDDKNKSKHCIYFETKEGTLPINIRTINCDYSRIPSLNFNLEQKPRLAWDIIQNKQNKPWDWAELMKNAEEKK